MLLTALRACHEANRKPNRVIHDTWATRPGNAMVTLRSKQGSHEVTGHGAHPSRGTPGSLARWLMRRKR